MDNSAAAVSDQSPPMPSNRTALLIVFIVVFIDLLGFAIVLPLLPVIGDVYVKPLSDNDPTKEGMILGCLMASFSLMQFLFAPVWGRLSDRIGRRPILMLGLAGSVVFYALLGYSCQLPPESASLAIVLLFLSRIGAGIAGATIGTAQAVIADSTAPEKRKHGMALIGMAFGIGFTFGPLLGYTALTNFPDHRESVGYTASALSLLALALAFLRLPETRKFASEPLARRDWNVGALLAALHSATIGPIILVFFLSTIGFASFETTLALFLNDAPFLKSKEELAKEKEAKAAEEAAAKTTVASGSRASSARHDINSKTLLFFAYVGFTLLLTQGLIYRRLAKRLSELTFMVIGILFMFAGVGLLSLVCHGTFDFEEPTMPLMPLLFTALTLAVMGFAFLTPSAQALISRRTSADRQGEVLGVNQSAAAMARILGPLIGIPLYKLTASHMLPYLFGAGLLILMLPLIPRIRRGDVVGA